MNSYPLHGHLRLTKPYWKWNTTLRFPIPITQSYGTCYSEAVTRLGNESGSTLTSVILRVPLFKRDMVVSQCSLLSLTREKESVFSSFDTTL